MSESSPFPTQTETRIEAVPTGDEATRSRRPLLALGGLALLLGAGGFLLLGGDDAEEDFAVVPSAPSVDAPPPVPQEVFVVPADGPASVGRNPFLAQYLAPTVAAPAAGTGTTSGTTAVTAATPAQQAAVVMQSAPAATQPAPAAAPAPSPASVPTPSASTPAGTPTTAPASPASSASPAPTATEPAAAVDDGSRHPITLLATDTVGPDGGGPLVTWGFAGKAFDVQPGQSFGRFDHLRVLQIIKDETREGVFLQLGDGTPFFVALDETVYVL